jgi:hypothetical protein
MAVRSPEIGGPPRERGRTAAVRMAARASRAPIEATAPDLLSEATGDSRVYCGQNAQDANSAGIPLGANGLDDHELLPWQLYNGPGGDR